MTIKDDFMKKILIGMFCFLFVFTIAMVVVFCLTGSTPDTLIIAVFGACAGEYSICGLIKKAKEKEKTLRLAEGFVEDYTENEDVTEDEQDYVACAAFEPIDEYLSTAHEGDKEEVPVDGI